MVTDVAPFTRLSRIADAVMVGHASYPGFTGDDTPASVSPMIHRILRGPVGFTGVVYSDDPLMGALDGSLPERAVRAACSGCDVLVVSKGFDAYEETMAVVDEANLVPGCLPVSVAERIDALRLRCQSVPRPGFTLAAGERLSDEVAFFTELLDKPRPKREPEYRDEE